MGDQTTQIQQKESLEPNFNEQPARQSVQPAARTARNPLSAFGNTLSSPNDIPLTTENILFLQRTIGNRAVTQLIQAKLKIGQPNDEYEREADQVADQVMRMPEQGPITASSNQTVGEQIHQIHRVQREQLHRQPEEEQHKRSEEETIQRQPLNEDEQRKRPGEEDSIQAKEPLGQTPAITPKVESQISNMRGGGEPLPDSTRAYFEGRFGRDFGDVRLHTGSQAADAAKSVNARAFTTGQDVVFGAGEYAPESDKGKRLLGHELTHVMQQTSNSRIPNSESIDTLQASSMMLQRKIYKEQYWTASSEFGPMWAVSLTITGAPETENEDFDEFVDDCQNGILDAIATFAREDRRPLNIKIPYQAGLVSADIRANACQSAISQVVGEAADVEPETSIKERDKEQPSTPKIKIQPSPQIAKQSIEQAAINAEERAENILNAIISYTRVNITDRSDSEEIEAEKLRYKEKALNQIRDLYTDPAMLMEVKKEYCKLTGGEISDKGQFEGGRRLEKDFKLLGSSSGHYKEALSILYITLTLKDRLLLYDNVTENEKAILYVLRTSTKNELNEAAKNKEIIEILKDALDDDEYYEARKIMLSGGDFKDATAYDEATFELVVDRIKEAEDFYDTDAVFNAILDLKPKYRKKLWNEKREIFDFLGFSKKTVAEQMCIGSEAQALKIRLLEATYGEGTEDEAVGLVVAKTANAAMRERQLQHAEKTGIGIDGKPLTQDQIKAIRQELHELGGIQQNLLNVETKDKLERSRFLEMLYGDVSSPEYLAYARQMGVSQYAIAKQQILDAIGTFGDDEESIYAAFDSLMGQMEIPEGKKLEELSEEEKQKCQQAGNRTLRESLLEDKDIQNALKDNLSDEEMAIVRDYVSADKYKIALRKLTDAYEGVDTDEERIFEILINMSKVDRDKLKAEKPPIFLDITTASTYMTDEDIKIVLAIFDTGKIPTETGLKWAFGEDWDGTEEEMVDLIFKYMDDDERYQYRLGYYLDKTSPENWVDIGKEGIDAHNKFKKLYEKLESELGTDDLQKAMDLLLGDLPTKQELKSIGDAQTEQKFKSKGAPKMILEIMHHRIAEKGDIREEDKTSSAIMDTFFDEGEVADLAEIQFMSAYRLASAKEDISSEEFTFLSTLHKNFEEQYKIYVAKVEQVSSIASTVAAIAAGIVITALSGGTAGPVIAGILTKYGIVGTAIIAGTTSALVKVGTHEVVGGSHYDATSTEGLRDLAIGFAEGASNVLFASLSKNFIKLLKLSGGALSGEMAAGIVNASNSAISRAGKTFFVSGLENSITGMLSGMVGELVFTATDIEIYKKFLWNVILEFGEALLKGAGIGAVTGFVTGGTLEALSTYVGVKRVQGLLRRLDDAGISEERLSRMSIKTVRALGKADDALKTGNLDDAEKAFKVLRGEIDLDELENVQRTLLKYHKQTTSTLFKELEIPYRPQTKDAFDPIRNITDGSDIEQISKLTGLSPNEVSQAKQHWMFDEHILLDPKTQIPYRSRFDLSDYGEDADRWLRFAKGKVTLNDVDDIKKMRKLVWHEYGESKIFREHRHLLLDLFSKSELEDHLRKFLQKNTKMTSTKINNLINQEKPLTPYRYAHICAHYSGYPNP